jgi:hypothetical protein
MYQLPEGPIAQQNSTVSPQGQTFLDNIAGLRGPHAQDRNPNIGLFF